MFLAYSARLFSMESNRPKEEKTEQLVDFLNQRGIWGGTIISNEEFEKRIRYLVSGGADPNCCNGMRATALMLAGARNLTGLAEFLLQAGADPNGVDRFGCNALAYALLESNEEKTHYEVMRFLATKTDLSHCDSTGCDVLSCAIFSGNVGAADLLIMAGVDPCRTIKGRNAYEQAQRVASELLSGPSHVPSYLLSLKSKIA